MTLISTPYLKQVNTYNHCLQIDYVEMQQLKSALKPNSSSNNVTEKGIIVNVH